MSNIYNFFLDIDGTLLPKDKSTLNDEVINALEFAHSKGCKIFINTGRTLAFVPYFLKTLDSIDGFCCGCGTYVEYNGTPIFEHYMSTEQIIRVVDEFISRRLDSDLILEGYDRMYYVGNRSDWYTDNLFIHVDSSDYFKSLKFDPKVQKFSTHSKLECRYDFFNAISDEFDTMVFNHYCETVPLGFDKGKALLLTEKLLGLDHELSVAVGDSLNDAAMLKCAKTSVAMGNATDDVKDMCDIITDTSENNGVAKIIYQLLS